MTNGRKIDKSLEDTNLELPLLFSGDSEEAHSVQYAYMDLVSNLYSENFSKRIGTWCSNHNVQYIGHVIEDNNAHARLGYGAGHFFRSMAGQDMAGIDVVLHQLMPQHNNGYFNSMTSTGWDGEFFHYDLAEMGTSLGRLDPRKHGNTMCEIFGAFGWSEDVTFMKWLADHMLVRGVNNFVPHAFSLKNYPDPDCPPHFYAHGNNPQFKGMKTLVTYMNRVSTIFSDGQHICNTAVLYHGEAEWSGDRMLDQKVTRKLIESQIGFEIVPSDYVKESKINDDGTFTINTTKFNTLIIPYSQRLPEKLLQKVLLLKQQGVNIVFVDKLPERISDNYRDVEIIKKIDGEFIPVSLSMLLDKLSKLPIQRLNVNKTLPWLRYYEFQKNDGKVYMLFNENSKERIKFSLGNAQTFSIYDPMENTSSRPNIKDGRAYIELQPSESIILYQDSKDEQKSVKRSDHVNISRDLNDNEWQINFSGKGLDDSTSKTVKTHGLPKLGMGDAYRNFAGTIVYSTKIGVSKKHVELNLTDVHGLISVKINNKLIATKIGTPYKFDLSKYVALGSNTLSISWTSSLGRYERDYLSQYMLLGVLGIYGSISLNQSDF